MATPETPNPNPIPWQQTPSGRAFLWKEELNEGFMRRSRERFEERQREKQVCSGCGRCRECGK